MRNFQLGLALGALGIILVVYLIGDRSIRRRRLQATMAKAKETDALPEGDEPIHEDTASGEMAEGPSNVAGDILPPNAADITDAAGS